MSEYEQEERPKVFRITNATWDNVAPQNKSNWYCETGHYMKLKSVDGGISRDVAAGRWECACKCISITARNTVFEKKRQIVQEAYLLHKFSYDIDKRHWDIESDEWTSRDESRTNSNRKIIRASRRQDIVEELQRIVSEELQITFENLQEYFLE